MSRLSRTVALVAVLAFLALSTFGAGWVMCTGAGGHAEIESLTAGCCGDDAPGHHDDEGDGNRGCGDCDDVLLAQVSPTRDAGNRVPDLPAPVASALAAQGDPLGVSARFAMREAPRAPPHPPPLPRHVRTTILRL